MHVFQCVRGFARGGWELSLGGKSQGSPPSVSVSNPVDKVLIDKKSRNNRQTEAERATRRAETID